MAADPEVLRARLHALGFDVVRFAKVEGAAPGAAALREWLAQGHHADMAWLERGREKREAPTLIVPNAQSLIVVGVNYGRPAGRGAGSEAPIWARYALHLDYHDTLRPGLVQAGRVLEQWGGLQPDDYRYYVDTGPVLERGWSARAGAGFIGKNAMLISPHFGNWLFLGALITRAALPPDPPWREGRSLEVDGVVSDPRVGDGCGKCTRCLDACPTQALPAPGVVDARRCISYQTIENKGMIPRELRAGIGARIYGCDVCAEVCPWNRFAQQGRSVLLEARAGLVELPLADLLALTPERFAEIFRGTAIKRLKLRGLLRNACIVAANTGAAACLEQLVRLAGAHPEPIVRAHAVWAVRRLGGGKLLSAAHAAESDPRVLDELASPLETEPAP